MVKYKISINPSPGSNLRLRGKINIWKLSGKENGPVLQSADLCRRTQKYLGGRLAVLCIKNILFEPKASYIFLMHVFNRQIVSLVFPVSEAVN